MFKKILLNTASFVILLLISLILFGGILKYSQHGGKKFIFLQKAANFVADVNPNDISIIKDKDILKQRHMCVYAQIAKKKKYSYVNGMII